MSHILAAPNDMSWQVGNPPLSYILFLGDTPIAEFRTSTDAQLCANVMEAWRAFGHKNFLVDGFGLLREANISRNIEWAMGTTLSLSFRGNELAGEVGEACNILKKIDREQLGLVGSRATVTDLATELADVVICCDLIAMDCGIDLRRAVAEKFNATSEARGLATRMEVG